MKEFIHKWSNWWILQPKRKQLDDAFEKELNELIVHIFEKHSGSPLTVKKVKNEAQIDALFDRYFRFSRWVCGN